MAARPPAKVGLAGGRGYPAIHPVLLKDWSRGWDGEAGWCQVRPVLTTEGATLKSWGFMRHKKRDVCPLSELLGVVFMLL